MNSTHVSADAFGLDHWSLLLYLETRAVALGLEAGEAVDYRGLIDWSRMRIDRARHPGHSALQRPLAVDGSGHPTRLKAGGLLPNHDDVDCLYDLEATGFVEILGTGLEPQIRITSLGERTVDDLRRHKANRGRLADFEFKKEQPR